MAVKATSPHERQEKQTRREVNSKKAAGDQFDPPVEPTLWFFQKGVFQRKGKPLFFVTF